MEPTSMLAIVTNALTLERELHQRIRDQADKQTQTTRLAPVGNISPMRRRWPLISGDRLGEYFTWQRDTTHALQAPYPTTHYDMALY